MSKAIILNTILILTKNAFGGDFYLLSKTNLIV